jgi:hypothetical protein
MKVTWSARRDSNSGPMRASGRPLEDFGMLIALAIALLLTVTVLELPQHLWGAKMWPFYAVASGALLWIAVDLRRKLRDTPAGRDAIADFADTKILIRDPTACPICLGARWVCEDHPTKPRGHAGCGGGAMPCVCNPDGEVEFVEISERLN